MWLARPVAGDHSLPFCAQPTTPASTEATLTRSTHCGILAVLLTVLLLPGTAAGQIVRGAVIDSASRTPVPGVVLQLLSSEGVVVATAESSGTGWFQLTGPQAGRYDVKATHPTWGGDGRLEVVIARGETLTVIVELTGTAIPLDPIIAAAQAGDRLSGFRERAAGRGQGRYIHRADIEQRPGAPPSELIAAVPGIRFERIRDSGGFTNSVLLMRSQGDLCMPAIYLDGLRIINYPGLEFDDLISSDGLEGIEIYSSHATAPLELHVPLNTCGVIALWSRASLRGRLTFRQMLGLGAIFSAIIFLSLQL